MELDTLVIIRIFAPDYQNRVKRIRNNEVYNF